MFPGAREMPRLDGPPPPLLDVHALRHIVPSSTVGSPRSRAASPSQNTRHQKRAAEQIADWLRDSERLKELQRRAEDAMRQADAVERARRIAEDARRPDLDGGRTPEAPAPPSPPRSLKAVPPPQRRAVRDAAFVRELGLLDVAALRRLEAALVELPGLEVASRAANLDTALKQWLLPHVLEAFRDDLREVYGDLNAVFCLYAGLGRVGAPHGATPRDLAHVAHACRLALVRYGAEDRRADRDRVHQTFEGARRGRAATIGDSAAR